MDGMVISLRWNKFVLGQTLNAKTPTGKSPAQLPRKYLLVVGRHDLAEAQTHGAIHRPQQRFLSHCQRKHIDKMHVGSPITCPLIVRFG